MIKHVPSQELKVGMYVHDLGVDWSAHPFMRSQFRLESEHDIQTILACGIRTVAVDTELGLDAPHAQTDEELQQQLDKELLAVAQAKPVTIQQVSLQEEAGRARNLRGQATKLVKNVMRDARLGHAIRLEEVEPIVTALTESMLRNPGALIGLSHIKNKDEYTFLHSVSVGTLMIAFTLSAGFDIQTVHQAGLGGLLHDTGKALVPDEILNKPNRLTDEEFTIIKRHPMDGFELLRQSEGIDEIPLDITLHHHERIDGSGYPHRLTANNISTLARMAAIVDVYDAITADRCYHKGMPPTEALRKIFEWSKTHLDPDLVKAFTRCIGIYPVGTLVLLESGRLGI
ncbi:MAG: HD-GYP domain-containing protein, partial [Chitinimonas sp.]|nr:HD-GYP domain-containing protein [Chitinimonas sp.]